MKKTSSQQKARNVRLGVKRFAKRLRRSGFKYAPDERKTIVFPETFSFSGNYEETVAALDELKITGHRFSIKQKHVRLDLRDVKEISIAAILVLASEIDRILTLSAGTDSIRFSAFRLGDWRAAIVARLDDLGFFRLLDVNIGVKWPEEMFGDGFSVVQMIGCSKFLPERVDRLTSQLLQVADFFEQKPLVYEAVVEAIHNTGQHAYPENGEFKYTPLVGSWWVTAGFTPADHEIRVVAFDQGVGIPNTLPRWGLFEQVVTMLSDLSSEVSELLKEDARMIAAALAVSRTSKSKIMGRGQGLSDVVAPIDELGVGRVRILSGGGGILYKNEGDIELLSLGKHIGGTLIEWCIPVGNDQVSESQNA
ncbi:hypothetical protein ABLN87_04385 [Ruegeria sp. SCPT10]|uniref:hypothetical protein n=1 Tax=Ruegeria sp. SCP10 TaxID=3141377 RepID=UPI00333CB8D8